MIAMRLLLDLAGTPSSVASAVGPGAAPSTFGFVSVDSFGALGTSYTLMMPDEPMLSRSSELSKIQKTFVRKMKGSSQMRSISLLLILRHY